MNEQFTNLVKRKASYIGGILTDNGVETDIVDIEILPNGTGSAKFQVKGKAFSCAGDQKYLTIMDAQTDRTTFKGFGDHVWSIRKK